MKLLRVDRVMIAEASVGVTSIASSVPIICSSRTLSENPHSETIR